MAVTLTIEKFGLDSEVSSLGEKVHSARFARDGERRREIV
jgi:hypothetical protein